MQNYSEIIGHEAQILSLNKDMELENVSHAYLFSGPKHIGKTLLIKAFSKEILCDCRGKVGCKFCKDFEAGICGDFMEVLDDDEMIKIDLIRSLIEKLNMSASGKAKVLFIENVERMNISAANAFLKILEEAPKQTHILMSCSNKEALLSTIVSRARVINLSAPGKAQAIDYLKQKFPEESHEKIIQAFDLSFERIGKAFGFLKDSEAFIEYTEMGGKISEVLAEYNITNRFLFVEKMLSDKETSKRRAKIFYEIIRYLLRKRLDLDDPEKNQEVLKILSKISGDGILLKRNINARLLIENLMLLIQ